MSSFSFCLKEVSVRSVVQVTNPFFFRRVYISLDIEEFHQMKNQESHFFANANIGLRWYTYAQSLGVYYSERDAIISGLAIAFHCCLLLYRNRIIGRLSDVSQVATIGSRRLFLMILLCSVGNIHLFHGGNESLNSAPVASRAKKQSALLFDVAIRELYYKYNNYDSLPNKIFSAQYPGW